MASTCPNCGKKLHFWNIKAECSACGVSIPNFDWEARLEEDNRNAEKAFGVFNRTLSRMAYSMWGTKLRIARLVLTFLPAVGFILPWSNIKGTGSSFVLSILAFDGSKSLIDFFKAFFGDVGLFTTTMGMEGYGGPVTLGVIGYFLFLLSALFIVIAFFMVLIRCKNSKTKTTIVFDVLSIAASVAAVICFTVGGQRGADLGAKPRRPQPEQQFDHGVGDPGAGRRRFRAVAGRLYAGRNWYGHLRGDPAARATSSQDARGEGGQGNAGVSHISAVLAQGAVWAWVV